MNCKKIRKIIIENTGGLLPSENKIIKDHLLTCPECEVYLQKTEKAQGFIAKLGRAEVSFNEHDLLAEKVISEIASSRLINDAPSPADRIFSFLQINSARYAFAAILFFIAGLYGYQEYYTIQKLTVLEKHVAESAETEINKASVTEKLFSGASWAYDLYKYINGSNSYWEATKNTIVINKAKLKKLLVDFDKLAPAEQKELLNLKRQLFPELNAQQLLNNENIVFNKTDLEKQIKIVKDK